MPKSKKKQENQAFAKKKIKVGKVLKKTAATDATFTTRKISMISQLAGQAQGSSVALSHRGLTIKELCRRLGDGDRNSRKEAATGLKQLLTAHPDLIKTELATYLPALARTIDKTKTYQGRCELKLLITKICTLPQDIMNPHFALLIAHTLRALANMANDVRMLGASILKICILSYPELCRGCEEIYPSVVRFLASHSPPWNFPGFLEFIAHFIQLYTAKEEKKVELITATLDFRQKQISRFIDLTPSGDPFTLSVVGDLHERQISPLDKKEMLLALLEGISVVMQTAVADINFKQTVSQRSTEGNLKGSLSTICQHLAEAIGKHAKAGRSIEEFEKHMELWQRIATLIAKKDARRPAK
ncbi:unnamed protein product, partial [Mesorhabditis spiculigera]